MIDLYNGHHREILETLLDGQLEQVAMRMKEHLGLARKSLLRAGETKTDCARRQRRRTTLRLLCWNVYNENSDAARIAACLKDAAADAALLQELTPSHLDAVRAHYPYVVDAKDYALNGDWCYLAIASMQPLADIRKITHFPDTKPPGSRLARKKGWVEFVETLSAETAFTTDDPLGLVVVHTSAAVSPTVRRAELEMAALHLERDGPLVVAGDFNSFSEPWFAPFLAASLNYRAADLMVRERRDLESWFRLRGYTPAVRGATFPRARLQLDHMFVRDAPITHAEISRKLWGSDHRPMLVTLA